MTEVREHFDDLFTSDCRYSRPQIEGTTIRVFVCNLGLLSNHPSRQDANADIEYLKSCCFIFHDVESSVRKVTPYLNVSESGGFGTTYREDDGVLAMVGEGSEYAFEGILDEPHGWVDWVIVARSFVLEIPGAAR